MPDATIAWTDPKILAALIAGGASLAIGAVNYLSARRVQNDLRESQQALRDHQVELENVKADLAAKSSLHDARLEYEYQARLRLYNACAPIMFQLSNAAERAAGRIKSFALSSCNGNIGPDRNWLNREKHGYYWASSYYRLLVPAAIAEMLKRRLTHLDLSLDGHLYAQYELALASADCFSRDFHFARIEPALEYAPHDGDDVDRAANPRVFWQQGVPRGILENAAALLVQGEGDAACIIPYNEFEEAVLGDKDTPLRAAILRIRYLFDDFTPAKRPILWRVLCAQFAIAQALIVMRDQHRSLSDAQNALDKLVLTALNWATDDGAHSQDAMKTDMQIGVNFAKNSIDRIQERLVRSQAANPEERDHLL